MYLDSNNKEFVDNYLKMNVYIKDYENIYVR